MNSVGDPQRLLEPRPRETELPFDPFPFATTACRPLPIPEGVTNAPTLEVCHRRRSRRIFGPLSDEQLSTLLWFAAKTLASSREASGFPWQHRPSPSGGGRHPVHTLVIAPAVEPFAVHLYEPEEHALLTLDISTVVEPCRFLTSLHSVLPYQQGTVLWFAADHLRTASRYENGESLIWRDAGALLATIGIAAEALDLSCCAYGPTGDEWVTRFLPASRFLGVGGCVIGSQSRREG
jgi:SagB-type dehydrogenase family enzyme